MHFCVTDAQSQALEIVTQLDAKKSILFSDEAATGTLHSYPDVLGKIERISSIFEQPKIILIIREQRAIIKSFYRMFPLDPRQSYGGDVVSFAKWVELEYRKKYLTYFDIIDYFQLIQKLEDTFGAPNILVLPLELLNFDKALFYKTFFKIL